MDRMVSFFEDDSIGMGCLPTHAKGISAPLLEEERWNAQRYKELATQIVRPMVMVTLLSVLGLVICWSLAKISPTPPYTMDYANRTCNCLDRHIKDNFSSRQHQYKSIYLIGIGSPGSSSARQVGMSFVPQALSPKRLDFWSNGVFVGLRSLLWQLIVMDNFITFVWHSTTPIFWCSKLPRWPLVRWHCLGWLSYSVESIQYCIISILTTTHELMVFVIYQMWMI